VKKILVTGARGFLGRYCIPLLLKEGLEIHSLSRHAASVEKGIIFHTVDLFERDTLRLKLQEIRPHYLLHCAWLTTPGIFWNHPDNLSWLKATLELLQAFGEAGGERALGIGSCAEYDWSMGGICREKATPLLPATVYGQSKLAAAQVFSAFSKLYGFSAAWGRLFFPYGIGEPADKFISAIIRGVRRREAVECSHGRQVRDFMYIEDVAEAIVTLLMSSATGAYNVASGQSFSLRDIVGEITSKIGGEALIKFGSKAEQAGEPQTLIADVGALFEEISWRPRIDLPSGIGRMIEVLCSADAVCAIPTRV